jgi:hypothetical protein
MKLPRHVMIGIGVPAVIAVAVGVLGYMHFSAPRKRTVVLEPKRLTIDEAAARKEVDARIAAYKTRGEPILVTDFKPKPIPPKDDAAHAYLAAIKWLDQPQHNDDPVWQIDVVPDKLTDAQWQQLDAAVTNFAPALALIDQADGRDAADWRIDFKTPSIKILLPALNGARHSANLLRMAALTSHRAGRHDETVHRLTQMTRLARHVDHGHPALVGHLVACGILRLTTETVRDVVPTLAIARATATANAPSTAPAPQGAASRRRADAFVAALLDVRTLPTGWVRCTIAERMFIYDIYESLIDGRLTMNEVFDPVGKKNPTTTPTPPAAELLADLGPVLDYLTGLVEASKHGRLPEFRSRVPAEPAAQSIVARGLLPTYDRAAFTHYATLAELRLAAAAVALRAYAADHDGARPPSLDALAPAYLPAIPDDPLAAAPAKILYADDTVFSAGVDDRKRRPATGAKEVKVSATQTTPDYAIRVTK